MAIPPLPEDLSYSSNGDFAVFIGVELAPTYGQWITVDADTDPDHLHAFGRALCKTYSLRSGQPCDEYGVMDTDGYAGLLNGHSPLELAVTLAEVAERLGERFGALPGWVEHRGRDYTLYLNAEGGRRMATADEIVEAFGEDYCGTYESEETYAQERFAELWDASFDGDPPQELQLPVFNYMNWERLAAEYEQGDVYYANTPDGTAVFWRS